MADKKLEGFYFYKNEEDYVIRNIKIFDNKNYQCESYYYYGVVVGDGLHIKRTSKLVPCDFIDTEIEFFEKVSDDYFKPVYDKIGNSYMEMEQKMKNIKNEYNSKIKNYFIKIKEN